MSELHESVQKKLGRLPDKPGVYMMHDHRGNIIYIGKAASLKNRVRSYFNNISGQNAKVRALVKHIVDFEYIITDSEIEALILECNLIKQYRPKYNVDLKDDKNFPYLKITVQEKYPRIMVTRTLQKDGARYFGPYTRAGALKETLRLVYKLFPVRTCKNNVFSQGRPCLNAHINRCLAPCTGKVDVEQYQLVISEILLFLEGKQDDLVISLEAKMKKAAANLEFEKAARLRDQIRAVAEVQAKQKIISTAQEDRDVIGLARSKGEACGQVFFVRSGKVIGRENFFLRGSEGLSSREVISAFLKRYYSQVDRPPPEVLVQEEGEEMELIQRWLGGIRGGRVRILVPQRGEKKKLVEMVRRNADFELKEYLLRRNHTKVQGALEELKELLGLPQLPRRIEGYDISNIMGTDTTGSMVVFEGGVGKPSEYRRFRVKTVEGPDDYAALKEILRRRFQRSSELNKGSGFGCFPNLVVIDGGKGQLNGALATLRELAIEVPVIALAKREEQIFIEGRNEPLVLPRDSDALYLLQNVRDKAHRFAISYHRNLRGKRQSHSLLDDIPGVGPKRKRALLMHFGSLNKVFEASTEQLAEVEGISFALARTITNYLKEAKDVFK